MRHLGWLTILLAFCLARAQTITVTHVDAGPLQLNVYLSETAQVFHIVDQISQWSEFSHRQYVRYFEANGGLSEEDREALAEHAAIRKSYGWGLGPEQAFYTPLPLEEALKQSVEKGYLTDSEAQAERRIFARFHSRAERIISDSLPALQSFVNQLSAHQSDLANFANAAVRFVGTSPSRPIPFYVIANPDDGSIGGGYNGGFLTLEIPRKRDAYPILYHELLHAFIDLQKDMIEAAVNHAPGLTFETFNEGMARLEYMFRTGTNNAAEANQLRQTVIGNFTRGATLRDSYARFNSYALALRPVLEEALSRGENLQTFLPRGIDAWRVLIELDRARPPTSR